MGLALVMTTIIGLISNIEKPPVPYIGYREVKTVIYLVKDGHQGVFIDYSDHPAPYTWYMMLRLGRYIRYEMPSMAFSSANTTVLGLISGTRRPY